MFWLMFWYVLGNAQRNHFFSFREYLHIMVFFPTRCKEEWLISWLIILVFPKKVRKHIFLSSTKCLITAFWLLHAFQKEEYPFFINVIWWLWSILKLAIYGNCLGNDLFWNSSFWVSGAVHNRKHQDLLETGACYWPKSNTRGVNHGFPRTKVKFKINIKTKYTHATKRKCQANLWFLRGYLIKIIWALSRNIAKATSNFMCWRRTTKSAWFILKRHFNQRVLVLHCNYKTE